MVAFICKNLVRELMLFKKFAGNVIFNILWNTTSISIVIHSRKPQVTRIVKQKLNIIVRATFSHPLTHRNNNFKLIQVLTENLQER